MGLAVAACHVPVPSVRGDMAAGASTTAPRAESRVAAGTVVQGTTSDGGTFEIRVLPLESGELEQARREVERKPGSSEAQAALGDELAKHGLFAEAIVAYGEAARLEPDDPVAHFRLGLTQHVVGALEDALVSYQETARLAPDSAWAHAAISIVHLRLGDPVSALREYRIVRQLDDALAENLFEIIAEAQELRQAATTSGSGRDRRA
jgi:tetratricopeptide (TPR) repeat protein